MNKRTILIVIGLTVAVVGFLLLTQPGEQVQGTPSEHKVGEGTTGVTLVEYGDFQCPACAQYFPVLQQVKQMYGDRITFQFRHFPLESIHKNARAGARAAEAAAKQGKFWEMHDHLFTYQSEWQSTNDPISTFENYARTIGVEDIEKFTQDYRSSEVNATISADLQVGRDLGVGSTPSFVLNGKLLEPNPTATIESFSALIDEAINASGNGNEEDDSEGDQSENTEADQEGKPEEDTQE